MADRHRGWRRDDPKHPRSAVGPAAGWRPRRPGRRPCPHRTNHASPATSVGEVDHRLEPYFTPGIIGRRRQFGCRGAARQAASEARRTPSGLGRQRPKSGPDPQSSVADRPRRTICPKEHVRLDSEQNQGVPNLETVNARTWCRRQIRPIPRLKCHFGIAHQPRGEPRPWTRHPPGIEATDQGGGKRRGDVIAAGYRTSEELRLSQVTDP